ncbi:MAG: hypothetical protein EB084_25180, partial [Proteobacteria bacterium]|nr:hypothetical protein [Pseudomonadota bacterium]
MSAEGAASGSGALAVHDPEVVQTASLTNVLNDEPQVSFSLTQLAEMGFLVPVADPATLRAAYAFRQKVLASILDPEHDFLFTISYEERGRSMEKITTSYSEAKRFCEAYKTSYKANPKKSGVVKLATAFGIEARIVEQKGLPYDQQATFAWCKYEVRHTKTGKVEVGQGYASVDERPGRVMPKHHCIALADTRAYSRAVLRLAGFGEVGAEEVIADGPLPQIVQDTPPQRPAVAVQRLPERTSSAVTTFYSHPADREEPVVVERTAAAARPAEPERVVQSEPQAAPIPMPQPGRVGDVITDAQIKKLSGLLMNKLGTKDRAIEWLKKNAGLSTTREVREADYPKLMSTLEAM